MNREELLTKLAMELEEWPRVGCPHDELPPLPTNWRWKESPSSGTPMVFPENNEKPIRAMHYLQRRTELINRPSWHDAPEWAKWLAQDASGRWMWYGDEPSPVYDAEEWQPESGKFYTSSIGTIPAGHNWRDTLEPRPEPQSDIKTCRHCDITLNRPHVEGVPDDRCTRCDDEIKALCIETEPAKSWWTSKTCTQCGHATAAKVSDDKPVCPGCVALGPDISSGQYAKAPCGSDADACILNPCGQCDEHEPALRDHRPGLNKMHLDSGTMQARSKYHREIKPGVWVDVYDVLRAWGVKNPALQHLIKKALAPGERGHKTIEQDMADIVASAKRAKELES